MKNILNFPNFSAIFKLRVYIEYMHPYGTFKKTFFQLFTSQRRKLTELQRNGARIQENWYLQLYKCATSVWGRVNRWYLEVMMAWYVSQFTPRPTPSMCTQQAQSTSVLICGKTPILTKFFLNESYVPNGCGYMSIILGRKLTIPKVSFDIIFRSKNFWKFFDFLPSGQNGQKKAIFRGPHTHVQISRQGCMVENRYYYRSRPYMGAFHPPERGPVCAPTRHTHPPSTIFGVQFSGPISPGFWGSGVKMTMVVPVGCTYWGPHLGWIKVLYECTNPQSFMS